MEYIQFRRKNIAYSKPQDDNIDLKGIKFTFFYFLFAKNFGVSCGWPIAKSLD